MFTLKTSGHKTTCQASSTSQCDRKEGGDHARQKELKGHGS